MDPHGKIRTHLEEARELAGSFASLGIHMKGQLGVRQEKLMGLSEVSGKSRARGVNVNVNVKGCECEGEMAM